jgi:hypothetical protein
MKTKRPYRARTSERMHAESVLRAAHNAMREVLEAWETPDSPEALACAIYQMKRIYMAEVIADLKKPKIVRPKKCKA